MLLTSKGRCTSGRPVTVLRMVTYHSQVLVHAIKLCFASSLAYMEYQIASQMFITPLTLVWEMVLILIALI